MGLYEQWKEMVAVKSGKTDNNTFWDSYLEKEKDNYQYILENRLNKLEGTLEELAVKFKMEPAVFTGFLDGINTSLIAELDLESIAADTVLSAEIDFEKLYWNMLDVKADWLYTLEQWEPILSQDKRNEITKQFKQSRLAVSNKVGRNDPCLCGSGKKHKKCCGK